MLATDFSRQGDGLAIQPYVELSFGVVGQTLLTDHGYELYSAISTFPRYDTVIPTLIPQGVEHYARIGTFFQSLNLRCRQAFITNSLLLQIPSVKKFAMYEQVLCMHEVDVLAL